MAAGAGTRDGLLMTLWTIAIILTTLCGINIDDSLDYFGFYWRGTVTMITTAALGILVFPLLSFAIRFRKASNGMIGLEIFILVIFWMLFLGASATIAVQWPSSFYCSSYKSYCRSFRAIQAFGWISLGLITILFIVDLIGGFDNDTRHGTANLPSAGQQQRDVGTTSTDPLHSKPQEGLPQQQPVATMA